MIQPNELRIGNRIYIEVGLPGLQLHSITGLDIADISNGRITLAAMQPVPLTREILEKCGFVKYRRAHDYVTADENHAFDFIDMSPWEAYCIQEFYIGISLSDGVYWQIDNGFNSREQEEIFEQGAEIKYLHQLQNRFQSWTGEELTIKL
jgi:hypothetical protein